MMRCSAATTPSASAGSRSISRAASRRASSWICPAALLGLPGEHDYPRGRQTDYAQLRRAPGPAGAARAARAAVRRDAGAGGHRRQLQPGADARRHRLRAAEGHGRQPAALGREPRVAFLCPVPGYDRHFAICQDFGIEMIPVPLTDDGPDMDVVERLVAEDAGIKGMWCVPKYSNPTGAVYSNAAIERLAAMTTAAPDFRIFWDNAYAVHHLTDERIEIASLIEPARGMAIRIGRSSSVRPRRSRSPAPASRCSPASADNVAWYLARMGKRTIGGDKVNQLRHVRFLARHGWPAGADGSPPRDRGAEVRGRRRHLPSASRRHRRRRRGPSPKGGYFISLDVLDGCATEVVRLAKEAGVELTPAGATLSARPRPARSQHAHRADVPGPGHRDGRRRGRRPQRAAGDDGGAARGRATTPLP